MIQISWNCQGLGNGLTVQNLRELIRSYNPSVVFLMETKQNLIRMNRLRLQLGFNKGFNVDPIGAAGGLSLWWRPCVSVEILFASKNLIDTVISVQGESCALRCSYFYGPPYREEKPDFWTSVLNLGSRITEPWTCMGDFNEILWEHEKVGGLPWCNNRIRFLKEFVDSNQLIDIDYKGNAFTWVRRQNDVIEIQERLDRGLANLKWIDLWPDSCVIHCPRVGSDHCPILLDSSPQCSKAAKTFKFEAFWADDPECDGVVANAWIEGRGTSAVNRWRSCLNRCRGSLKRWSKDKFPNHRTKINELTQELEALQTSESWDCRKEEQIQLQLGVCWKQEESYWRQRSRAIWLKDGDQNTRFFHLSTAQRRRRNRVVKLRREDGTWFDNDREIRASFDDYYQNLFSTSGPRTWGNIFDCIRPSVTREMNLALCKPISDEEVKTAVLQLGSLKAPGPDGFPGMFYQKYWEHVNGVVNDAATGMGLWGEEMWKINATHIALIPKVPCPENATQFRPISLCNNSYKILAKILANRLKQILPHIISHHQNAFVPDRQVHDNLIVAHEAFHYLKLKKKGKVFEMGLKLDMNKAYDRVEWDFLEEAMVRIGFDRAWINLIMSCVTTVSFSVMVNGKPGRYFKPHRGLRQGDPLSPYLFLVVSEILSLNLSCAIDLGVLQGIKLCRGGPTLSHIFFADDSLFFLKASKGNCRALNRLLEGYCLASGQRINFEKSVIFMSPNTPLDVRNEVSAILKVPMSNNPGNYLGLPTMWGRSKKLALQYVLERILKKIQGWKAKALTMAGREVLIKAVAMAVPTYPMSCFKFPSTMCKAINTEISRFWWGATDEGTKVHWKNWEGLCQAKSSGGMGFRDLEVFNQALLAKQCWRLWSNPHAFWARLLKARYFPNADFAHAQRGSRPSWIWSSLLEGRKIMLDGARWQVGNGTKVDIWKDNWLPCDQVTKPSPTQAIMGAVPTKVNGLIDSEANVWNLDPIQQLVHPRDLSLIRAIPLCNTEEDDRLVWPWDKRGTLTVKSGYFRAIAKKFAMRLVPGNSSHQVDTGTWKVLWSLKVVPKIKNFMWRAISNALPTTLNLFKRKITTRPLCSFCGQFEETPEHMLLLCPWVHCVWLGSPLNYRPNAQQISTLDGWLFGLSSSLLSDKATMMRVVGTVGILWWEIWKERCSAVFENRNPIPEVVLRKCCSSLHEMCIGEADSSSLELRNAFNSEATPFWRPPPSDKVKVNVDGAWNAATGLAGVGCVIRNSNGDLLGGESRLNVRSAPIEAEAEAVLSGLHLAKEQGHHDVVLECDSQEVVQSLRDRKRAIPWKIYPFIQAIRRLVPWFSSIHWTWIPRTANKAAHVAATIANLRVRHLRWASQPPPSLVLVLSRDGLPGPPS